jgi:uncharacterized protein with von Willebrand factor type A (vWA) domain
MMPLAERIAAFPAELRAAGLGLSVDAGFGYLRALDLEPTISIEELFWTGRVMLVTRREDLDIYDRLFRAWFLGDGGGRTALPRAGDQSHREGGSDAAGPTSERRRGAQNARNAQASLVELVHAGRETAFAGAGDLVRAFERYAPRERARRFVPARSGPTIDLRATLRRAVAGGGDITQMRYRKRLTRRRPTALLVDVSRSMKGASDAAMVAAALLVGEDPRVEVFALGTRLTRATEALRHKDAGAALARAAALVADWDGGTRLGDTLATLLADGRNLARLRGSLVVLVSDALERGDPAKLATAVERLSRLAHRLVLATPLMADPRYRPSTRALQAILPSFDLVADGSDEAALARLFRRLGEIDRAGRRAGWRLRDPSRSLS